MADWTKDTPLKVGLHPPEQCARGRTDCRSLAQVISSQEPRTFICCGEVAPGATPVPQDQWSFCMGCDEGGTRAVGTDMRIFIDRVDMSDMAYVLATGLSMTVQRQCTCHPDDKPPVPCPGKFALTECRAAVTPSPVDIVGIERDEQSTKDLK